MSIKQIKKRIMRIRKWSIALAVLLSASLVIWAISMQMPAAIPLTTGDYTPIAGRPPELPNSIPDFPVYPGAAIIRIAAKPPDLLGVGMGSNDPPETVFAYLMTYAKENGWIVEEQQKLAFRARKDTTIVTISISQNPGEQTAILEQVRLNAR